MPKPTGNLPTWSTSGTNQLEPSAGEKDAGYAVNGVPTSSKLNWLFNRFGAWIVYLSGLAAEAWTWTAAHIFQSTVQTQAGITATQTTANMSAIYATGNGGAAGATGTGGGTSGAGVRGEGGAPNGIGVSGAGAGTGSGVEGLGGASGNGVSGTGLIGGRFIGAAGGAGVVATGGDIAVQGYGAPTGGRFTGTNGAGAVGVGTSAGGEFHNAVNATAAARKDAVKCVNGDIDLSAVVNPGATVAITGRITPKNIVKAWARIRVTAGVAAVVDGFNISSVTRTSTAGIQVAFAAPFANASYGMTSGASQHVSGGSPHVAALFASDGVNTTAAGALLTVYTMAGAQVITLDVTDVEFTVSFLGAQ